MSGEVAGNPTTDRIVLALTVLVSLALIGMSVGHVAAGSFGATLSPELVVETLVGI